MLDIRKSNLLYIPLRWKVRRQPLKKKKKKQLCRNPEIATFLCALDMGALTPHIPWAGECRSTAAWLHNRVKSEVDAAAGYRELEQGYELSHRSWCRTAGWWVANAGLGIQVQKNDKALCLMYTGCSSICIGWQGQTLMSKSLMMADLTNLYIHSYR